MNAVLRFVRTTVTGGILFLLPITILFIILSKAFQILGRIAAPLVEGAPPTIFGIDGSRVMVILLILVLCFISGLLFKLSSTQKWIKKLEDNFICYLPGYTLMKSLTADAINQKIDAKMEPVMIKDGDMFIMGFLTEENDSYCTVFLPGAPQHDSGEIKIVPSHLVHKVDMPMNKVVKSIKTFGIGMTKYAPANQN